MTHKCCSAIQNYLRKFSLPCFELQKFNFDFQEICSVFFKTQFSSDKQPDDAMSWRSASDEPESVHKSAS